jgi:hypothetical protein
VLFLRPRLSSVSQAHAHPSNPGRGRRDRAACCCQQHGRSRHGEHGMEASRPVLRREGKLRRTRRRVARARKLEGHTCAWAPAEFSSQSKSETGSRIPWPTRLETAVLDRYAPGWGLLGPRQILVTTTMFSSRSAGKLTSRPTSDAVRIALRRGLERAIPKAIDGP